MSASLSAPSSFPRSQLLGYISLCLIWGSTWLAIRVVVEEVPPLRAAAIRFLVAGVLLLGVARLQKRTWPSCTRAWQGLLVLSVTMMAIPYGLIFWAEQYVASSMAAVLYSAIPLVVALLTPLMIGGKVPRSAVLAMVIGFGGLLDLLYGDLRADRSALWRAAGVMTAMLVTAWSVLFAKKRLQDVDSVVATGIQLLFGSVVLFLGTWVLEGNERAHWTPPSLMALVFLTIIGSCIAFVIYYWLLKRMQPYQLSTTSLIVPVIAVIEGGLLGHERISLRMLIPMAIVLASVGSVLRAEAGAGQQGEILALRGKTS